MTVLLWGSDRPGLPPSPPPGAGQPSPVGTRRSGPRAPSGGGGSGRLVDRELPGRKVGLGAGPRGTWAGRGGSLPPEGAHGPPLWPNPAGPCLLSPESCPLTTSQRVQAMGRAGVGGCGGRGGPGPIFLGCAPPLPCCWTQVLPLAGQHLGPRRLLPSAFQGQRRDYGARKGPWRPHRWE